MSSRRIKQEKSSDGHNRIRRNNKNEKVKNKEQIEDSSGIENIQIAHLETGIQNRKDFAITDDEVENIPNNTQVSSSPEKEEKEAETTSKVYKKKAINSGITDRAWLSSKENKNKWTAVDGKRGMCNDCKKMFSSRQVSTHLNLATFQMGRHYCTLAPFNRIIFDTV